MRCDSDTARPRACRLFAAAALCLLLVGVSRPSTAEPLYVVCNSAVSLTPRELRDVFLGEKQFAGTVRLKPADNVAAQEAFLAKVLMMELAKYTTTWIKKSFRDGINPLPSKAGNAAALEYVRKEPGACSYVSAPPGSGVVIVLSLDV